MATVASGAVFGAIDDCPLTTLVNATIEVAKNKGCLNLKSQGTGTLITIVTKREQLFTLCLCFTQ